MRGSIFVSLCFIVLFCFSNFSFADEVWEPVSGIKESDIREVSVDPYNEGAIYVSSSRILYKTKDGGGTWRAVFSARGDAGAINFIGVSKEGVFVCTEKGVFNSPDGETGWKRIFKGVGMEENSAAHIAFSENNKIYLGTKNGLFLSSDAGLTWEKDSGTAGNVGVKWITFLEGNVFLATEKGVYRSTDSRWERVFVTSAEETGPDSGLSDETISAAKPVNSIITGKGFLFLATGEGVFVSEDRGYSWKRFSSAGLVSQKVKRLLFRDNLYAATEKGIYVFNEKDKIWRALYKGMTADKAQSMAADNKGIIWVATNKGLYTDGKIVSPRLSSGLAMTGKEEAAHNDKGSEEEDILKLFDNEPNIRNTQKAAIRYAETHPDKIGNWRRQARMKALLPELSVDYDKTINYDSSGDRYYIGPHDWGISAKWDLGEIVWNKDQTSIDVRSKLMVQLRDDILDEVTRTYFERRRLQIERYLSLEEDLKLKLEKELRVQELTADLDALTGGYFSEQLKP